MAELVLNDPQRRAVGVRLRGVGEAVATLRRAGIDSRRLAAIERLARETALAARVPPPLPEPSLAAAMVAEILTSATELGPANLRRYGALDEQTAARMALVSERLTELAAALGVAGPAPDGGETFRRPSPGP